MLRMITGIDRSDFICFIGLSGFISGRNYCSNAERLHEAMGVEGCDAITKLLPREHTEAHKRSVLSASRKPRITQMKADL